MTRKHFNAFAEAIRKHNSGSGNQFDKHQIETLIEVFQEFNSRFNADRFREACKSETDKDETARNERILELAKEQHQRDGECEIDDNAVISEGGENGTYVQSWVWVDFADTDLDKDGAE